MQDGVVQQFTRGIEHHGFAAGAKSGVDRQETLATERRGEQEFAQVFGKHADRGFVGAFFCDKARLGFHRGHEQAFAAVLDSESHLFASLAI